MISSIVIIAFSVVLLVYWFRYTCLLILRTKPAVDYASDVVAANQLAFPEIRARLDGETGAAHLAPLHEALVRDYRLLTYLLEHSAGLTVGGFTLEQRMLMLDFNVMRIWYAVARRLAVPQAQRALQEMSGILDHFANDMGERAAASARN
jgi:hypothetical protein